MSPPTDEITSREALAILGFTHLSTISRYVGYGRLTPSRRIGNVRNAPYLFWRADVQRLADDLAADRRPADEPAEEAS